MIISGTYETQEWFVDNWDSVMVCLMFKNPIMHLYFFCVYVCILDSQPLLGQPILASVVHVDNVQCTGNEMTLLSCNANMLGEHNCNTNRGAGVRCEGNSL